MVNDTIKTLETECLLYMDRFTKKEVTYEIVAITLNNYFSHLRNLDALEVSYESEKYKEIRQFKDSIDRLKELYKITNKNI